MFTLYYIKCTVALYLKKGIFYLNNNLLLKNIILACSESIFLLMEVLAFLLMAAD